MGASEGFSRTKRGHDQIGIRQLPLVPLEDGVERSKLVADIILMLERTP